MYGWLILWNTLALFLYMTIAFVIAKVRKRIDTVDAAWAGGFVVAAWLSAGLELHARSILIAVLVDIWAIRLASHIIERSRKRGEDDPRYTEIAAKWGKKNYWLRAFVSIFLLQGLLVIIVSSPVVFATGRSVAHSSLIIAAGVVVWALGFAVEALGDRQLQIFISDPSNKGKVLDQGLWHYSRHPNYLGEITQWYGIGIIACSARYGYIGLIGPIILNVLIRFVSGVPPIENRKKKDKAYAAYMQRTNALWPKFSRAVKIPKTA